MDEPDQDEENSIAQCDGQQAPEQSPTYRPADLSRSRIQAGRLQFPTLSTIFLWSKLRHHNAVDSKVYRAEPR